jgi:hypothetical protein
MSSASQPIQIPARPKRAQRASKRDVTPADAAHQRKTKPTKPTETRTNEDYSVQVAEPWRTGELPRCIVPLDDLTANLEPGTWPPIVTTTAAPPGSHDLARSELELADVGVINPWQAFGNTLYEAWLKGP